MASAPLADLDAGLTSWFSLQSRRRLTLGGDGGSVMFVLTFEKDVGAASSGGCLVLHLRFECASY